MMWKLNAKKLFMGEEKTEFEQIFSNYVEMKNKEKELRSDSMITLITPMTQKQVEEMSEKLLSKFVDLHKGSLLN